MDISVCLDDMLRALDTGERETAADCATDALAWFARGGFRPRGAGMSYVDMVARSLHVSADTWTADEMGEESVSLVPLGRVDRSVFTAAMQADGRGEYCDAAHLVTRVDGRGLVWPEFFGSGRAARARYDWLAAELQPVEYVD